MKTEDEIRAEIELLIPTANADEDSFDREMARNLCTALLWVLDGKGCKPSECIGYTTMRIVKQQVGPLEVKRYEPENGGE